jgi:hypothetical protein
MAPAYKEITMATVSLSTIAGKAGKFPSRAARFRKKHTKLAESANAAHSADEAIVGVDDALTVDNDGNVAGLSSSIALANALKATYNTHFNDTTEHTGTAVGSAVAAADATDLASLITLTTEILSDYDTHDDDAEQAAPTYHPAQEAGDASLASAVAPTTLAECITRLNDAKAKINTHVVDGTAHTDGDSGTESTSDAAMGAAVEHTVSDALSGDYVIWGILDSGSGSVTGVSAVAGTDKITFTFSANPQADTIVSYAVLRPAS